MTTPPVRATATTSRSASTSPRRPAGIDKIVFPVSIYDADNRSQNFGQVRNAFIRIINQAGEAEIARYDLSEDASTETAMVFGELYRAGAEWKFRAVGQGYAPVSRASPRTSASTSDRLSSSSKKHGSLRYGFVV